MPAADNRCSYTDPKSLINLINSPRLKELIEGIPLRFWGISEDEVVQETYGSSGPKKTDLHLRFSLWRLYELARQEFGGKVRIREVCRGICSESYFLEFSEKSPGRLMYIITDPTDAWVEYESMLHIAIPRMREILMMPNIKSKRGQPDHKLMALQFQLFQYLDQRQRGAIVQKIQSQSVNVNLEGKVDDMKKIQSVDEIDQKLAELEKEVQQLPAGQEQPVIDLPVEKVLLEQERVERYKSK